MFGRVTASCLNVRCGPGISYNRIGKIYKGEYVDVFAKVGNWYIVKTDSDLVGAVSSDYLEAVYNEEERYSNLDGDDVDSNKIEEDNVNDNNENLENDIKTSEQIR